jgi:hypothetical protein
MARTRMIKPEFWSDEKLALLSLQARLTYIESEERNLRKI